MNELVDYLSNHTNYIPDNEEMEKMDYALACAAVETAVSRHAGSLEQVYTPCGLTYLQSGKDLRRVKYVVVTGGALIHAKHTEEIAKFALYDESTPALCARRMRKSWWIENISWQQWDCFHSITRQLLWRL